VQPRNLSMIPDDPAWAEPGLQSMLERTRSSLVPENAEAFGADDDLSPLSWGLIIAGVAAIFLLWRR